MTSKKVNHKQSAKPVRGSGGKGSASLPQFYEAANTIRSEGTLRVQCLLSAGPIEGLADGAKSIRLDGVPVKADDGSANLPGIAWQIRTGTPNQKAASLPGFNATEQAVVTNRALLAGVPVSYSRNKADAVRLLLRFSAGLYHRTSRIIGPASVSFKIEVKKADVWQEVLRDTVREKQTSAFEKPYLITLPEQASRHTVRITRLTPAAAPESGIRDIVYLANISWVLWDRLSYPDLAVLTLAADARSLDGQLPRLSVDVKGRVIKVPANYDPATRSYTGIWDGRFKRAWSDNPAWVIWDLLTDPVWGAGMPESQIDRYDLYRIARDCDQQMQLANGRTEPKFTFNAVLDRRQPADQLLERICSSVQAMYFWSAGKLRFSQDREQNTGIAVSNANVVEGRFVYHGLPRSAAASHVFVSYSLPDSPGEIAVESAVNEDQERRFGYRAREVFLLGCTRPVQAARHARWLLDALSFAHYAVSWQASLDHFAGNPLRPGDIISLNDRYRQSKLICSTRMVRVAREQEYPANSGLPNAPAILIPHPLPDDVLVEVYFQTQSGSFRHAFAIPRNSHAMPDKGLFVLQILGASGPYAPAINGVVSISRLRHGQAVFFRVMQVSEQARGQVEVTALPTNYFVSGLNRGVPVPPPAARQPRPVQHQPLARAGSLTSQQTERIENGQLQRFAEVSWLLEPSGSDPAGVRVWQVTARGPEDQILRQESNRPHLFLGPLAAGRWQVTIQALGWHGQSGVAISSNLTILADLPKLPKPAGLVAVAGIGQIALSWTQPPVGAISSWEVWQTNASGQPLSKLQQLTGTHALLGGLVAGTNYQLMVRYQRQSGSYSPWSDRVSAVPLAAPPGPQGTPGRPGTQIVSRQQNSAVWSDSEAVKAVRQRSGAGVAKGDMVTLYKADASFVETRIYDGSSWQKSGADINGHTLISGTVAAKALALDGVSLRADPASGALQVWRLDAGLVTSGALQSTNYVAGTAGFAIHLAGSAEFNDVTLRGVLRSSRVESSLMVSPLIVMPTQKAGRFLTHARTRQIEALAVNRSGQNIIAGQLQIKPDSWSDLLGDAGSRLVIAGDRRGDNSDASRNSYYSRLRRTAPLIRLVMRYTPYAWASPWGQGIESVKLRFAVLTDSNLQLARSAEINTATNPAAAGYASYSARHVIQDSSFEGPLVLEVVRLTRNRPGHSAAKSGYTEDFTLTLTCRPKLDPQTALSDAGLKLKLSVVPKLSKTFSRDPMAAFASSFTLAMDTIA